MSIVILTCSVALIYSNLSWLEALLCPLPLSGLKPVIDGRELVGVLQTDLNHKGGHQEIPQREGGGSLFSNSLVTLHRPPQYADLHCIRNVNISYSLTIEDHIMCCRNIMSAEFHTCPVWRYTAKCGLMNDRAPGC